MVDEIQPENTLQGDLKRLLNRHGAENRSNTPDHILAEYLIQCLAAFDYAVRYRATWYDVPFPDSKVEVPGEHFLG